MRTRVHACRVRFAAPGLLLQSVARRLFTPFVTTKARGLGIGLTIVRSIVDAHGSTIVARHHLDGGATFTVTLRRSAATSVADAVARAKDRRISRWSWLSSRMMVRRAQRWDACSGRRDSTLPSSNQLKPTSTLRRRPRALWSTCSSRACPASSCSSGCAPPAWRHRSL